MSPQKVIISEQLDKTLEEAISECEHDITFVLADETTAKCCIPVVEGFDCLKGSKLIVIEATDAHKNIASLMTVWKHLSEGGATRHTLLINIGGGMVTDLGGFAASTFKRGINYINIPTTLLSMVDASVGGKTGINFLGLKNEIGVFNNAKSSGYAEMLKHGLINNEKMLGELLTFDIEKPDLVELKRMVAESVAVKQRIVTEDPTEKGIRKALNLGHTAGHAFESFALKRKPVLHGYAVAWGLVVELYLSAIKTGFPSEKMHQTARFILDHYGKMDITCDDYPTLLEFMTHDKKNVAGIINFTLLGGVGDILINQTATKDEIYEALDFYRES